MKIVTTSFLLWCSTALAVDGVATVTSAEGSGEIVSVATKPLVKGATFGAGSRVKTASKSTAIVMMSNGSKILVNPEAVVHFKVLTQVEGSLLEPDPENKSQKEKGASMTEIEVESGKVIGDVKKLASGSIFTLKTPVGTVTIKGTVFSVEFKKDKDGNAVFNVGCLVGKVVVQMADPKAEPMSIPAGKCLSMTAQEGSTTPPKMEIAPLPPAESKAMSLATPDRPATPPAPPPPPSPAGSAVDNVINQLNRLELSEQVINPSPTGG